MSNIRLIISTLLLSIGFISARAQTLHHDEGVSHWEAGIHAGLNNDGYEAGLRGLYFPIQYVGVKVGLSAASQIEPVEDWWKEEWEKTDDYAHRIKFNPAIVFRSPRLIKLKNKDGGFYLFAEPGMVLSPGAPGSRHAKCFRWDFEAGVNFQVNRLIFTLGYGISNFSLFSGSPYGYYGPANDTEYLTHSIFIGLSFKI